MIDLAAWTIALTALTVVITAVAAVFSWKSARAAMQSAESATKAIEANLTSNFLRSYTSYEMYNALHSFRSWLDDSIPKPILLHMSFNYYELCKAFESGNLERMRKEISQEVYEARWRIYHYWRSAFELSKVGYISDNVLRVIISIEACGWIKIIEFLSIIDHPEWRSKSPNVRLIELDVSWLKVLDKKMQTLNLR